MSQVFISYSEEDSEVARGLAEELRKLGLTTWTYEENGLAGISYLEQVHAAIHNSHPFVLLASASSLKSHNVIREAEIAYESKRLIIPLRLGISPGDLSSRPIFRMVSGLAVSIPVTLSSVGSVAARIIATLQHVADSGSKAASGDVNAPQQHPNVPSGQTNGKQTSAASTEEQIELSRGALAIWCLYWGCAVLGIGLLIARLVDLSGHLRHLLSQLPDPNGVPQAAAIAISLTPAEIESIEGTLRMIPFVMIGFGLSLAAGLWTMFQMVPMSMSSPDKLRGETNPGVMFHSAVSFSASDARVLLRVQLIAWALLLAMTTIYTGEVETDLDYQYSVIIGVLAMGLVWVLLWQITRRKVAVFGA